MAILDKIRLSGTTYDIVDSTAIHSLDGYYTTGETNAAITAATNALAESIAEQGYQTSGDVQNAISGKVDTSVYTAYTAATDTVLDGKVDTDTYTAYTAATDTVLGGKQDTLTAGAGISIDTANTISVTGIPLTIDDAVTSSSSNPVKSSGIYDFVTGETATKQDTLVSGTNIKSINNESLLGSGNISTLQASVSGTTLILN